MKSVMKRRYYCEFCKKSGAHAGHMRKHEKHCTGNPDRECGLCALMQHADGETTQRPMSELVATLTEKGLEELRNLTRCPACILSAMVQERKAQEASGEETSWYDFDYKKEFQELMREYNPLLEEQQLWR